MFRFIFPTFFVIISLIVLFNVFLKRLQVDSQRRMSQFGVTEKYILDLKELSGNDLQLTLAVLKDQVGITSVVVPEYTIEDYEKKSKLTVLSGYEIINTLRVGQLYRTVLSRLRRKTSIKPNATYIIVDESKLYKRVINYVKLSMPLNSVVEHSGRIIQINATEKNVLKIPLGFSSDMLSTYDAFGFNVIPELKSIDKFSKSKVEYTFSELEGMQNVQSILFSKKFNFEISDYFNQLVYLMKRSNYYLIFPEFSTSKYFNKFASKMPSKVVRAHISEDVEFDSFKNIFNRYNLALNERSVQLLIFNSMRTKLSSRGDIYDKNILFMRRVIDSYVRSGGKQVDFFSVLVSVRLSLFEKTMLTIGLFCMLFILLLKVHNLSQINHLLLLSFGLFIIASAVLFFDQVTIPLLGVMASILGPIFAMVFFFPNEEVYYPSFRIKLLKVMASLGLILLTCFISAIYCVAFYFEPVYLQNILPFKGVKLSLLVPFILVGLYYYCGPKRVNSVYYVLRRLLRSHMTISTLVMAFIMGCIVTLYLLRSGNYLDVNFYEQSLRNYLNDLLFVRPRFKEILLGYPALFLALWWVDGKIMRNKLWLFNALGCIALSSLINSFCHFHTPLIISTFRMIIGVFLGVFISILFYYMYVFFGKFIKSLSIISK